jgi:hypothetical protein
MFVGPQLNGMGFGWIADDAVIPGKRARRENFDLEAMVPLGVDSFAAKMLHEFVVIPEEDVTDIARGRGRAAPVDPQKERCQERQAEQNTRHPVLSEDAQLVPDKRESRGALH